ncbi:MAG: ABC transporter ATP-binding protein [Candidatus Brocadiia bacterium]
MAITPPTQMPEKAAPDRYLDLAATAEGAALRELQHAPPEELAEPVREQLEPDEKLVFTFSVDMDIAGRYGQQWLVLTDRRCASYRQDDDGYEAVIQFPLEHLRGVRLREMTGNHMLFVDRGDGWERLLRSSNMTAWKLKPARQVLEQIAEEGPAVLEQAGELELTLPERDVCEKCGRAIHPRLGVCVACMNKRKLLLRMLSLLLPYLGAVFLCMGLLLTTRVLTLVPPLVSKWITDLVFVPAVEGEAPVEHFWYRFGEPGSMPLLLLFGGIMLGTLIVPSVVGALRGYVSSWIGNRIVVDLSNRTFSHMMRLSLSFYHHEETGRVMSRITRDVNRIHRFLSRRLFNLVGDVLMIVLIVTVMVQMHLKLAIIVLAPIPILAISSELARRKVHHIYHMLWRRYAAINRFLGDVIPGIRVVKAFAQGGRERGRFEGIMDRVFDYEMRATKVQVILQPVFRLATGIGQLLVFVVGGWMLIEGDGVTIGLITAFTGLMYRFYQPVMDLARALPEFERAATSADRVFEVLDSEPELETEDRKVEMPTIEGEVEFRNVTFGYEPDEPVLKEMSFTVEPGEMIGLVGHSGAGKTTVINLVCHFYKVDEGQVLIDGHDLTDVKVESLRRQIGIVSQEPFLFSGTIAENIAYSKPDATPLEVIAAAKAANAHDFIVDMPEGYDTLVGERGARVSGGERQRIAIARAILKNPRILILDEATASVDTETEERIQEALRRLIAGRTTFAIAHRLSTLKYANRLLVLEEGRLVEKGTHEELVEMDGVYAGLCEKQSKLSSLTAWSE